MKYQNKQNGQIAELVSKDEKFKTVMIQKEGDSAPISISTSTFKRWWKLIDDSKSAEKSAEEVTEDEQRGVVEKVEKKESKTKTETEKEGKKPAKKTTEKTTKKAVDQKSDARPKGELPDHIVELNNYIFDRVVELGGEVFVTSNEKLKFRSFKVDGHMFATYNFSKNRVTLNCRSKAIPAEKFTPHGTMNYAFDLVFVYHSPSKTSKDEIDKLLKLSIDYQRNKKSTKRTKKEEK